jgi:GNAT superfamily N-acetyltransferase
VKSTPPHEPQTLDGSIRGARPSMQALESAAFEAWPSEVSIDLDGWLLRLDRGYTKRANSANATAQSQRLSHAAIDSIEARFRDRGLTPTFRLTSFAPVAEADALLASRGYDHREPSLVMSRTLSNADADGDDDHDGVSCDLFASGAASWLQAFQTISGKSGAEQAIHLDILRRIAHPCAWAVIGSADSPQSCGLGVLISQELGLFDIATRVDRRRLGLARQLCGEILAWGRERGAHTAFLQVAEANGAAVELYENMGFEVAYRYWYRVLSR